MKKMFVFAVLAAVAMLGTAVAQTPAQVSTVNPTTDLLQIIPNGKASAQSKFVTPALLGQTAYAVVRTPTEASVQSDGAYTGYTNTFSDNQAELILLPALTMSYAYVTMAPNPSDGARECVFSKSAITALWVTANTGQSVSNQATALSANSRTCMTYSSANATWYRSQ